LKTNVYCFTFAPGVDLTEAEATLHLAILACEGLFGEARVRMEVSYCIDPPRSALTVDGCTPAGDAAVLIFAAFLTQEFGPDGFTVGRLVAAPASQARTARASVGTAA